jgi:serine/threonine-protein kinase
MDKGDKVTTHPIEPTRDRPGSLEILEGEDSLGEGGMGLVRDAIDRELGRRLAYKQLHSDLMDNDLARRAFVTEAQVTAQLDHPHIVPVYELGRHPADSESEGESLYFTMKRVQGRTLAEILDAQPVERRTQEQLFLLTQVFSKVCDAIDFAHSHGVIHRDLKPDNIMVGDFGQVYVVDWGVALIKRVSESGATGDSDSPPSVMGTPGYMSPEQAQGYPDAIDQRSDIFSLGACLYELLTGVGPYAGRGTSPLELLTEAVACEIEPPQERVRVDLPAQLSRVAMKAMSKNPEDRFQSVGELKAEVDKFMQTYSFFPRVTFEADTIIVQQGEPADAIYVLVEGSADVVRSEHDREVHVRHLRQGDVFGEVAVFANRPRTATVRALTEVTAVRIAREQMSRDNEIGYWFNLFTKALAERFLEKEQQIEALQRRLERLTRKSGD